MELYELILGDYCGDYCKIEIKNIHIAYYN